MQGRARSFEGERELLGDASIPFPPALDKAGDPMPWVDYLGSDGWEGEVMRKSVTPADKCIGRLSNQSIICGVTDPVQGSPFAMLNNGREPLVPLAPFTNRLEEIFELRGLHVLGPAAEFGGEDLVQFFAMSWGPGEDRTPT